MVINGMSDAQIRQARIWAAHTNEKFKHILRTHFENCLDGRPCVPIVEFVDYFNQKNVQKGFVKLDTKGLEAWDYFKQLCDVCRVDSQLTHLYPVRRHGGFMVNKPQVTRPTPSMSPRQSQPPTGMHTSPPAAAQRGRSMSSEPAIAISKRSKSMPPPKPSVLPGGDVGSKSLSIGDVQQILVAFTHGLAKKTLSWTEYCEQLEAFDPMGMARFRQLRPTEQDQIDFIKKHVSGIRNRIEVDVSEGNPMLSILMCSCCGSCPQLLAPSCPPSEEDEEEAFFIALRRFKIIELPLKDWVEVSVTKVDPDPRKLVVDFSWKTHHNFDILHEQLIAAYQNNTMQVDDLKVGTVCALPYESTRDFHRAVVKDVSNPSLPVVLYVDLGVELEVARGCLRKLHERFFDFPIFHLSGVVRDSPPYEERRYLAKKLLKKERVLLRAEKYDRIKGRYVLALDTDSGITSDASR